MTRRSPAFRAKKTEESSRTPSKKHVEAKSEESLANPLLDREGKPELETPEKPSAPPEDSPRDDESPLETREEDDGEDSSSPEEAIVVEDAPPPVVRQEFPMVSPDEQALLRAQHNL